jgi:hypothetical protein
MTMIRLVGRFRVGSGRRGHLTFGALATPTVAVAVAALIGCSTALAATTPGPTAPSYLFSITSASGSLTGANAQHLTLRLAGTRNHLTRFAERSPLHTSVVANVDFARRFERTFAGSQPNAVLTDTRSGGRIPETSGLAIGQPRWDAHHHTWMFPIARATNQTGGLHGTFTRVTLLIEDAEICGRGVVRPYEDCHDADLAFDNLTDTDLTGVNFSGANLTGANLSGADLSGADLAGADLMLASLTESDLVGSDLTGEDLTGETFIGANLTDANLSGANLTGAVFSSADLTGAWLTDANLSDAVFTGADLINTNLSGADVNGGGLRGARLCDAVLPGGGIGGGC